MSNYTKSTPYLPRAPSFPSGPGLPVRRYCMSCGLWRGVIGSAGVGVRWRCASCLQKKETK